MNTRSEYSSKDYSTINISKSEFDPIFNKSSLVTCVGGNITGGGSVCSGVNSTTLNLSGYTGTILKWQSAPSEDFQNPTDIVNSTDTHAVIDLLYTTYYRVIVITSNCETFSSTEVIIGDHATPNSIGDSIDDQTNNLARDTRNEVATDLNNVSLAVACDLDSDGDTDIITEGEFFGSIKWWMNDGSQNFTQQSFGSYSYAEQSIIPIDIDADDDLDVIIADSNNDQIVWLENDGSQNFTENIIVNNIDRVEGLFVTDLNQDGSLDLLSTSYNDDNVYWHENDGSQNFITYTIDEVLDSPVQVFSADLDNDEDLDVIALGYSADELIWYQNDGNQNFTKYLIAGNINGISDGFAIDMDDDGDFDIVSCASIADEISWWENQSNASVWSEHIISSNTNGVIDIHPGDFDGDGDIDVSAAVSSDDRISWFENEGPDSFTEHIVSESVNYPRSIFNADFDQDGDLDILGVSRNTQELIWWENVITPASIYSSAEDNLYCLEDSEVVYASSGGVNYEFFLNGSSVQNGTDSIWMNINPMDGDDVFLIMTDVNGCSRESVHLINGISTATIPGAIIGGGSVCAGINSTELSLTGSIGEVLRWESSTSIDFGSYSEINVETLSFNVTGIDETTYFRALIKNGGCDSIYSEIDTIFTYPSPVGGFISGSTATCNFGNSTDLTLSGYSGSIQMWQSSLCKDFHDPVNIMNTTDSYTAIDLDKTTYYRAVISDAGCEVISSTAVILIQHATSINISESVIDQVANEERITEHIVDDNIANVKRTFPVDLDDDGDMDILGIGSANNISYWENDGTQDYNLTTIASSLINIQYLQSYDIDQDGDMDIIASSNFDYTMAWWENDGSQGFTEHAIVPDGNGINSFEFADIDQDGDIDFASTTASGHKIAWWENDGNLVFTENILAFGFSGAIDISIRDLDDDGDYDIIGAAQYSDDVAWWKNNGHEQFTKFLIEDNFNGSNSIYISDIDSDGDLDIVGTAYNWNDVAWWENDGSNEDWTRRTIDGDFLYANDVVACDLDGDLDVDIVATAGTANEVAWWENDGNQNFTKHLTKEVIDSPGSLFASDLDIDGDLDILVAALDDDDIIWWENVLLPAELESSDPENDICPAELISFNTEGGLSYEFFLNGVIQQAGTTDNWSSSDIMNLDTVSMTLTNINGCQANSIDFIIEVSDPSIGGNVIGGSIVCSESNNSTLEVVNHFGEIIQWQSSTSVGFSSITTIQDTSSSLVINNINESTYFRAQISTGCDTVFSSIDSLIINQNPVLGGEIIGGTNVCSSTNSTTLNLQGHSGTVLFWESSFYSDFENSTVIANTTDSYTPTDLTFSKYFRATVTDGTCSTKSDFAKVNVIFSTPINIGPTVNDLPNGEARNTEHIVVENFNRINSAFPIDMNNDGILDVVSYAGIDDIIVWFENGGNGVFSEHIISSFYEDVSSVFAKDMDNDGDIDILASARNSNNIHWWENDSNGGFTKHLIDNTFVNPSNAKVVDVDLDGDQDIIVESGISDNISWWENNGNQNYTERVVTTYFNAVNNTEVVDLDGDGDLDILASAAGSDEVAWWVNDGNQNFSKVLIIGGIESIREAESCDLDNDGDLDILIASYVDDYIAWLENDGNENFAFNLIEEEFDQPNYLSAYDLDNDGDLDIIGNASFAESSYYWWENDGNQNFTKTLISSLYFGNMGIGDMDGDGDLDVIGASRTSDEILWWENVLLPAELISSDENNTVCETDPITFSSMGGVNYEFYLNRVSVQNGIDSTWLGLTWSQSDTVHVLVTYENGCQVSSVDYIIDSAPRIPGSITGGSIVCPGENQITLIVQGYDGEVVGWESSNSFDFSSSLDIFSNSEILVINNVSQKTYYRALIDNSFCDPFYSSVDSILIFDNNVASVLGSTSLCEGENSVSLSLSGYTGTIEKWQSSNYSSFAYPVDIINTTATLDLTNITKTTYYRAVVNDGMCNFSESAKVTITSASSTYFGNIIADLPDGEERDIEHEVSDTKIRGIYSADLDGDGDNDILGVNTNQDQIIWLENDGSGVFIEHLLSNSVNSPKDITAEDLDGDGDLDIMACSSNSTPGLIWWINDGNANFIEQSGANNTSAIHDFELIDMDDDGDLDVVASRYLSDIYWYENDGNLVFTPHFLNDNLNGSASMKAGDLDGDGDIDLAAVVVNENKIVWWENDGNQNFIFYTLETNVSTPIDLVLKDVDGDGDIDFIAALLGQDEIAWWENNGIGNFTKRSLSTSIVGILSVYASDLDDDGDIDIMGGTFNQGKLEWFQNDGNQVFTKQIISNNYLHFTDVYVDDFNGDGKEDILACFDSNNSNGLGGINWYENVLIPAALSSSDPNNTVCSGDNLVFTSSAGETYEFFRNDVSVQFGPDSTYIYSNPIDQDTVHVVLTDVNGCEFSSVDFIINSETLTELDETICGGETYNFNGIELNTSGIYFDTISRFELCDSIIQLDLFVDLDSDGDGVCDTIDQCLDTPVGEVVNEFGCPLCPDLLEISSSITSGLYKAEQIITADGQILNAEAVEFNAGAEISLEVGFEVEVGAEFLGIIQDCSEGSNNN